MEFDRFNFGVRDVDIDRRTRELGSWYQLAKHIGDEWKLDEPTKERIDKLIRDIKMGKVTEEDDLSTGQISEVRTGGLKGSTDKGIQNILDIVEATEEYEDPFKIAATVLVQGINKHPFNDGNHRTMWIVAKQALRKNDEK
ncbi:MAG: Fic family protein, partial [Candidatus Nanohaloarchaea archaeon]